MPPAAYELGAAEPLSLAEVLAAARARPGKLNSASSGPGNSPHLTLELFKTMARVDIVHVPYKGATAAIVDLVGGQVDMMFASMPSALPLARAGKLRILAISSATRVASLPEIPAVAESGLTGYEAVQWTAMMAPAATPADILSKLQKEIVAILRTNEIRDKLAVDGAEIVASSPEEFATFLRNETVKWAAVVKAAGIAQE